MGDIKKFKNEVTPTWCPGCGDFSVLRALQSAAVDLNINNHDLVAVSGIGCSGRISGYLKAYGFHGIHGRSLPIAQGVKIANPNLTVIALGGDGDGFAIGTNHTIHAMKRNIDITYIVMNNQIYGLTKGHTSPLSKKDFITKSTPFGHVEDPLKPGFLALASGSTFIAQGFSAYQDQLIDIITKAINHKGFSFVNVFSPCVTFNKINTYQWFRDNLVKLENEEAYDQSNFNGAVNKYLETGGLFTGILYESETMEYQERLPINKSQIIVDSDLDITGDLDMLLEEFM